MTKKSNIFKVKSQGADHIFNHREKGYMEKIKSLYPDGLELVLEMLANVNLENDINILKWKKGRVVVRFAIFYLK